MFHPGQPTFAMGGASSSKQQLTVRDGFIIGSLFDGTATTKPMLFRQPATSTGAYADYWDQVGIPGLTGASMYLTEVNAARNLVQGIARVSAGFGMSNEYPFIAPITGTDHVLNGVNLANAVPGAHAWEARGWVNVDLATGAKPQPLVGFAVGSNPFMMAVIDVADGGTTAVTSNDAHVIEIPSPLATGYSLWRVSPAIDFYDIGQASPLPHDTASVFFTADGISAGATKASFAARAPIASHGVAFNFAEILPMPTGLEWAAPPSGGGGGLVLPLDGPKGNQYNPDPNPGDGIWQYATYFGDEQLVCNGVPCNKRYFSIALGFDPTASCTVYFDATADDDAMSFHGNPPGDTM